ADRRLLEATRREGGGRNRRLKASNIVPKRSRIGAMNVSERWDRIDDLKFADEAEVIARLLADVPLPPAARSLIGAEAAALVEGARAGARHEGVVESFLKQFSLGTREGLALMCLAEALLRTPDADTRDRLIAEKIAMADWASHLGKSDSLFVNA